MSIHPANKLANVKRRAERAMGCETCPASRWVMMQADALARGFAPEPDDLRDHAAAMYAVLEALWKARAEVKRLRGAEKKRRSEAGPG